MRNHGTIQRRTLSASGQSDRFCLWDTFESGGLAVGLGGTIVFGSVIDDASVHLGNGDRRAGVGQPFFSTLLLRHHFEVASAPRLHPEGSVPSRLSTPKKFRIRF